MTVILGFVFAYILILFLVAKLDKAFRGPYFSIGIKQWIAVIVIGLLGVLILNEDVDLLFGRLFWAIIYWIALVYVVLTVINRTVRRKT